jgi:hypothetical protein
MNRIHPGARNATTDVSELPTASSEDVASRAGGDARARPDHDVRATGALRGYVILIGTSASLETVRATIEDTLQIQLRHARGGAGILSIVAGLLGVVATTPQAWFLLTRNPLKDRQGFEFSAYQYALLMHPSAEAESYASTTLEALKVHGWSLLLIRGLAEAVSAFEPDRLRPEDRFGT